MNVIECESFVEEGERNLMSACTKLFEKEDVSKRNVEKLALKLYEKELTLRKLYVIYTTDPWYNTLDKIVRSDWRLPVIKPQFSKYT